MENQPIKAINDVERSEIEKKYESAKIMIQVSEADPDIKEGISEIVERWRQKALAGELAGEGGLSFAGFNLIRGEINSPSKRENKKENSELLNAVMKALGI